MSAYVTGRVKTAWHRTGAERFSRLWGRSDGLLNGVSAGCGGIGFLRSSMRVRVHLSGERWGVSETATQAGSHRRHECLHTDDIHDPREIVSEHVQGHFGSNLWQASHQEVRCAHSHLKRTEGMLDGLAAQTHGLRVFIETLLHGFEHVLMLPSADAPLRSCGTARFQRTAWARRRPIAA